MRTPAHIMAVHARAEETYEREWTETEARERRIDEVADAIKSGDEYSAVTVAELQDGDALFHLLDWASRGYKDLAVDELKVLVEKAVKLGAERIVDGEGRG